MSVQFIPCHENGTREPLPPSPSHRPSPRVFWGRCDGEGGRGGPFCRARAEVRTLVNSVPYSVHATSPSKTPKTPFGCGRRPRQVKPDGAPGVDTDDVQLDAHFPRRNESLVLLFVGRTQSNFELPESLRAPSDPLVASIAALGGGSTLHWIILHCPVLWNSSGYVGTAVARRKQFDRVAPHTIAPR
jgi:hypothetical protein